MEGRIQQSGGKRYSEHVVARSPHQVLPHDSHGRLRKIDGIDHRARLRPKEKNVAGLLGEIGAASHGDASIGLRQRGRIVDAITDHRDA